MRLMPRQIFPFLFAFFLVSGGLFGQDLAGDSLFEDSLFSDTLPPEEVALEVTAEDEIDEAAFTGFSLKSPYHTVYSHLYYLQDSTYFPDTAAMTLFAGKSFDKKQLAIQLKQYLDGAGYYIDLDNVPADPKFVDSTSGKWKYILIEEVPDIYLYRKNGKWFYSNHTVRKIPELFQLIYPYGTLDWIPNWAQNKGLGLKIWQWLGIFCFILAVIIVYKLLAFLLTGVIEGLVHRFLKKDIALKIIQELGRPLSMVLITVLLKIFVPILQLPPALNKYVILGLEIIQPIFIVIAVYQLVDVLAAYFLIKAKETETVSDDQLIPLLRKVAKGLVVVAGGVFILQTLGVDPTTLVAGIGVGGLAIALAAQDTVKNFIGSILIFLDRPFQIGDWIVADGVEGTVEEVGVRATRIRTFANSLVYVPNGTLADTNVNNMGLRVYRRFMTKIGLTYDTPPEKLEAFVYGLRQMIKKHPGTRKDYYEVWFNEMGDSSLNILMYTFFDVPTWTDELKGKQDLLFGIMRLAQTLGVSFAFPTQTLHIENFPEKSTLTPAHPGSLGDHKATVDEFLRKWDLKERDGGIEGAFAGSGG